MPFHIGEWTFLRLISKRNLKGCSNCFKTGLGFLNAFNPITNHLHALLLLCNVLYRHCSPIKCVPLYSCLPMLNKTLDHWGRSSSTHSSFTLFNPGVWVKILIQWFIQNNLTKGFTLFYMVLLTIWFPISLKLATPQKWVKLPQECEGCHQVFTYLHPIPMMSYIALLLKNKGGNYIIFSVLWLKN